MRGGVQVWVSSFGFRVSGFGFRVSGFGFRVSGFGFRVSGVGMWVAWKATRDSDAIVVSPSEAATCSKSQFSTSNSRPLAKSGRFVVQNNRKTGQSATRPSAAATCFRLSSVGSIESHVVPESLDLSPKWPIHGTNNRYTHHSVMLEVPGSRFRVSGFGS